MLDSTNTAPRAASAARPSAEPPVVAGASVASRRQADRERRRARQVSGSMAVAVQAPTSLGPAMSWMENGPTRRASLDRPGLGALALQHDLRRRVSRPEKTNWVPGPPLVGLTLRVQHPRRP